MDKDFIFSSLVARAMLLEGDSSSSTLSFMEVGLITIIKVIEVTRDELP